MEMVAAAKLRRFQDFLESARPYTQKLEELLDQIQKGLLEDYQHPYFDHPVTETPCGWLGAARTSGRSPLDQAALSPSRGRGKGEGEIKRTILVLFTSDTGLCGTYNAEIEGEASRWIEKNPDRHFQLAFVGKHGANYFHRKGKETLERFFDLRVSHVDEILKGLTNTLEKAFLETGVHEIYVAYTHMESLSKFRPAIERILPIKRTAQNETQKETIVEPDPKTVMDRLLPAFFESRLRLVFYHALLTEQIARMNAMRQATQNAKEMIDELTLSRNKARQAAITKEIIEIVSGSRALRLK